MIFEKDYLHYQLCFRIYRQKRRIMQTFCDQFYNINYIANTCDTRLFTACNLVHNAMLSKTRDNRLNSMHGDGLIHGVNGVFNENYIFSSIIMNMF